MLAAAAQGRAGARIQPSRKADHKGILLEQALPWSRHPSHAMLDWVPDNHKNECS